MKKLKFGSLRNKIIAVIIGSSIISTPLSAKINSIIMEYAHVNDSFGIYVNTLISLIITTVIAQLFISGIVIKPLKTLLAATKKIAAGDLSVELEHTKRGNDEISELAEGFQQMTSHLRSVVRNINETTNHIAAAVEQLATNSDNTATVSEQISAAIQGVASGSEEQASGIERIASAMDIVSNEIDDISENTRTINELSQANTKIAENGVEAVDRTVNQMGSIQNSVSESDSSILVLQERSKEIGQFLTVITNIAEQTNLLALNAAIEAARAGESGKGFAVVAEEVRKLAEESSQSAQQIAVLVNEIQNQTKTSVDTMKQVIEEVQLGINMTTDTKDIFHHISKSMLDMNGQVQNILEGSQKIFDSTHVVTSEVGEVSSIAQQNSQNSMSVSAASQEQLAAIEEVSTSTKELAKIAENLQALSAKFQV
ncbi:methyl-accepting chemotaxis protein [Cytobacillus sp. Hz8]|uniref:methyl-accepting chemotaxis protein n=1 Tax=Cytobacillus sp. Hz8 TaxID=3347168 RepID=UPI0035E054DA